MVKRFWDQPATEGPEVEKKKITTITSETHEVLVIKRPNSLLVRAWCKECAAEVDMLTPDEAVLLTRTTARSIYRRCESGQFHFTETPAGQLFVCLTSLSHGGIELQLGSKGD